MFFNYFFLLFSDAERIQHLQPVALISAMIPTLEGRLLDCNSPSSSKMTVNHYEWLMTNNSYSVGSASKVH